VSPTEETLEQFYDRFNRREFVHPDPIEFLYPYKDIRDRELVAFIASSLAYGRVGQILKSVAAVLDKMSSPARFIRTASRPSIQRRFFHFKHRFTTAKELISMLGGLQCILNQYDGLEDCFTAGLNPGDETVLPALSAFTGKLISASGGGIRSLVPEPEKGSACKRLHLFLRWMVRRDAVDPGGWDPGLTSKLIVPIDTHMHRIGLALGFTRRRQADRRTAVEITSGFRKYSSHDPVKYDFSLTRLGIRKDLAGPAVAVQ
jgi:uncharacterized protein (TIGR02757 family)